MLAYAHARSCLLSEPRDRFANMTNKGTIQGHRHQLGRKMLCILVGVESLLTQPTLTATGARHLAPRSSRVLLQVEKAERPAPFAFFQRDDDVPADQQPVAELQALRNEPFYDWADTSEGLKGNLLKLFVGISLLLSLPVSYNTYTMAPV